MQGTEGRAGAHGEFYEQAAAMQARLLFHNDAPKTMTPVYYGDYEAVRYWEPIGDTGGDFAEVIDFQYRVEDFLCVGIADSNTSGVPALMLMAQFQSLMHAFAPQGPSPAAMLEQMNRLFFENTASDLEVTAFVCMVNLRDRDLVYANAGHPAPVWFHGDEMKVLSNRGEPLGKGGDAKYEDTTLELAAKDRILMYTDGLLNASPNGGGDPYGEERLFKLFQKHRNKTAIPAEQAIAAEIVKHSKKRHQDDLTMMILDYSV